VTLAKDPDGYDPEGLVAMPDGSFWVSDEYGPFITHFTAQGEELARLSPFKTGPEALPAELKNRVPNRGMEGLTLTPDGHTHEYLFLLDEPATTGVANSEITALSDNTFLIDERDSGFPSATGEQETLGSEPRRRHRRRPRSQSQRCHVTPASRTTASTSKSTCPRYRRRRAPRRSRST
jgi:hypothetical protein